MRAAASPAVNAATPNAANLLSFEKESRQRKLSSGSGPLVRSLPFFGTIAIDAGDHKSSPYGVRGSPGGSAEGGYPTFLRLWFPPRGCPEQPLRPPLKMCHRHIFLTLRGPGAARAGPLPVEDRKNGTRKFYIFCTKYIHFYKAHQKWPQTQSVRGHF